MHQVRVATQPRAGRAERKGREGSEKREKMAPVHCAAHVPSTDLRWIVVVLDRHHDRAALHGDGRKGGAVAAAASDARQCAAEEGMARMRRIPMGAVELESR
jgi:hypothetical protein